MKPKIIITGSNGFIGKNLRVRLEETGRYELITITREDDQASINSKLKEIDVIFHLAGANRPETAQGFVDDNVTFTENLLKASSSNKPFKFIFTSTTQIENENEYGNTKRQAEEIIKQHQGENEMIIYRLPNVFGKWSRPNYNSGVITFCYNASRGLPLAIHDPDAEMTLVYIDDVVNAFIQQIDSHLVSGVHYPLIEPTYNTTVGALADMITGFRNDQQRFRTPDFKDPLLKKLYSTYVSYMDPKNLNHDAVLKKDNRGMLFELVKNEGFGQIFVSHSNPGVVRGNHYHHSKVEKFCVIRGEGLIKFRAIESDEVFEYPVSGENPMIIEIPPGYTHNLANVGKNDMITLFWANEIFDDAHPDTIKKPV